MFIDTDNTLTQVDFRNYKSQEASFEAWKLWLLIISILKIIEWVVELLVWMVSQSLNWLAKAHRGGPVVLPKLYLIAGEREGCVGCPGATAACWHWLPGAASAPFRPSESPGEQECAGLVCLSMQPHLAVRAAGARSDIPGLLTVGISVEGRFQICQRLTNWK